MEFTASVYFEQEMQAIMIFACLCKTLQRQRDPCWLFNKDVPKLFISFLTRYLKKFITLV